MCILKFINGNDEQISEEVNIPCANTFRKRLFGLMGKSNFSGLLFKQKYANRYAACIHTSFMRVPIDVIYIDDNNRIMDLITLSPWKLYIPKNGYIKYIIELPENSIREYKLEEGVKVVIKNEKKKTGQTKTYCTDGHEHNPEKVE